MKKIAVIFSERSATGENPENKITLFWNLKQTPIAERYFKSLKIAADATQRITLRVDGLTYEMKCKSGSNMDR